MLWCKALESSNSNDSGCYDTPKTQKRVSKDRHSCYPELVPCFGLSKRLFILFKHITLQKGSKGSFPQNRNECCVHTDTQTPKKKTLHSMRQMNGGESERTEEEEDPMRTNGESVVRKRKLEMR